MKRNNVSAMLIGITLVLVGGGYLLAELLGFNPSFFFRGWWTLFLISPSLASMIETRPNLGNGIVLAVGLLLLASSRGWLRHLSFSVLLAVVMVILGVRFLVRAMGGFHRPGSFGSDGLWDTHPSPSYSAFFTTRMVGSHANPLMSGNCYTFCGQLKVDLSEAVITGPVTVFCNAMVGNIQVIPPQNCRLVVRQLPVLGVIHHDPQPPVMGENLPVVTLDCTAVLGSVEIF